MDIYETSKFRIIDNKFRIAVRTALLVGIQSLGVGAINWDTFLHLI